MGALRHGIGPDRNERLGRALSQEAEGHGGQVV